MRRIGKEVHFLTVRLDIIWSSEVCECSWYVVGVVWWARPKKKGRDFNVEVRRNEKKFHSSCCCIGKAVYHFPLSEMLTMIWWGWWSISEFSGYRCRASQLIEDVDFTGRKLMVKKQSQGFWWGDKVPWVPDGEKHLCVCAWKRRGGWKSSVAFY